MKIYVHASSDKEKYIVDVTVNFESLYKDIAASLNIDTKQRSSKYKITKNQKQIMDTIVHDVVTNVKRFDNLLLDEDKTRQSKKSEAWYVVFYAERCRNKPLVELLFRYSIHEPNDGFSKAPDNQYLYLRDFDISGVNACDDYGEFSEYIYNLLDDLNNGDMNSLLFVSKKTYVKDFV